jgi:predicted dehydrogenase
MVPLSSFTSMLMSFLAINYIMASLGPISTFHSILANQRPKVDMVNEKSEDPKKIVETVNKDTPDQLLLQGKLESGAVISYHLRGGDAFPGQPALTWEIYGEKGVIVITHFVSVLDIVSKGCSIKMQIFGEKDAQTLELPEDEMSSLKGPSENVGRIYEAVAAGKKGGDGGYPDWEMGFERHELIEEMWKRSDGSEPFGTAVQKS